MVNTVDYFDFNSNTDDKSNSFKPSMFNRLVRTDDKLVLYNSFVGAKGITIVPEEKVPKVLLWLKDPLTDYSLDSDFQKLVKKGFLVPFKTNEYLKREEIIEEFSSSRFLNLVIYTTNDCNFRCKYCALDFKKEHISADTCDGIVNYVRKNIKYLDGVSINWFGGEPLLRMDSIEYISQAVKKICKIAKKPYVASITTNGFLLTPQNSKKLFENNVLEYTVTVDGSKETHDKYRCLPNGEGTYDIIIRNLLWIKNNIKSNAINVIIRTNFTKDTLSLFKNQYNSLCNIFKNDSRFSLFARPASDWGGERVKNIYDQLIDEKNICQMYDDIFSLSGEMIFKRNIEDLNNAVSTCSAVFKNKFTIGVNGDVYKCDDANENLKIGHLYSNGEMTIDADKRLMWERGYRLDRDECKKCYYSCSCFFGVCPKVILRGEKGHCIVNDFSIDNTILYAAKVSKEVEIL